MRNNQSRTGRDLTALALFVIVCLAVAAAGGAITADSVDTWYPTLVKPPFNPPDWVFAPVWTTLYICMAVAAWRVWRTPASRARRDALLLFAVQLVLNLAWSALFFGLQRVGAASIEIVVLLIAIAATGLAFRRIDRLAGLLFVPYLLWVAFASALTFSIWWLN